MAYKASLCGITWAYYACEAEFQ